MIDGKNVFDQPVKSDMRTIARVQGDDYITGCLLDYNYSKKHYKIIATDLSKQKALDTNSKSMQQINFTGNIERHNSAIMFFIIKEVKELVLDFSQGITKML